MPYIDSKVMIMCILKGLWVAWPLYALILAIAVGKLVYRLYEMNRLARSGVNDIDKMDGKTFEKYLEVLFIKLGYRVERTSYTGDYGADLLVGKDRTKTIIQAKRYKKKVGVKTIQEAVAAKGYYKCDKAMVVTNSFYTNQAKTLAHANKVELWDRNDLVKAVLSVNKEARAQTTLEASATLEVPGPLVQEAPGSNKCVICGELVSEKVKQYCLNNTERFGGAIYCFQHQKGVKQER